MTFENAFNYVANEKPDFIHVSGKTSTGKSTFARRLERELGYKVVELDTIVQEAVIRKFNFEDEGRAFYEVYKERNRLDWIESFIAATQKVLYSHQNHKTVIDGAVANMATLKELLNPFPDMKIIYFHPSNIKTYESYLTNRFTTADSENNAGLPAPFWRLIPQEAFMAFCKNRHITTSLSKAIQTYASDSQRESDERFKKLQGNFSDVLKVEI